MNRRVRLILAALCVSLAGVSLVGCASLRASGARHRYIESKTESHVYDKALASVWPEARQLLFAKGYSVKDTDASSAETEWKKTGDDFRNRILLTGTPLSDSSCKVQFMKEEQQRGESGWRSNGAERDLGLEWELIRKVSPEVADQIQQEADAEGQKAAAKQ